MSTLDEIPREVTWNDWRAMGNAGVRNQNAIYRIHMPNGTAMYGVSKSGVGAFVYDSLKEALEYLKEEY